MPDKPTLTTSAGALVAGAFFNRGGEAGAADAERVPDSIIERQLGLFAKVHPDYAEGVRAALGLVVR